MIIRMSVVNFETVLTVGWGCHGDFLQVGNLDWLFEGKADLNSGRRVLQCWSRNSSKSRRHKRLTHRRFQPALARKLWVRAMGREC